MDLLLKNLIWHDGIQKIKGDVRVGNGVILELGDHLQSKKKESTCDFENNFIYPGLINSHDHLEMNLYPKLGSPIYNNYVEWANDIYKPKEPPILEIEKVDIEDRLLWGGIKNLIAGATTVVHHNPWHRILGKDKFPVKVLKNFSWAHSLQFGKSIIKSFPKEKNKPFIIHAAEGKDDFAFSEISKLHSLGLLRSNTILVHGIALSANDIQLLESNQSSLAWCPSSNLFMFGVTAPIPKIKNKIKITLGSDSTLTGSPTLLDEIAIASNLNIVDSQMLFEMVTQIPSTAFRIPKPSISISSGADFFISPIKNNDYFKNLTEINSSDLLLVAINGELRLLDSAIQLDRKSLKGKCSILGKEKNMLTDINSLKKKIEKKVGNKILEKNPLWTLLEI